MVKWAQKIGSGKEKCSLTLTDVARSFQPLLAAVVVVTPTDFVIMDPSIGMHMLARPPASHSKPNKIGNLLNRTLLSRPHLRQHRTRTSGAVDDGTCDAYQRASSPTCHRRRRRTLRPT